jgi:DNA-binding NarL/FixJ family response regulator
MLAAAASIRGHLGAPRSPADVASVNAVLATASNSLSAAAFQSASDVGEGTAVNLTVEHACTLAANLAARETPASAPVRPADHPSSFGLTARELEVLRLVVEGLTNPEIAVTLYISHKTVRNHMTSILGKLGVDSRTAAATVALRRRLV